MVLHLVLDQPLILTLPGEILFDICLRLDCRGLLAVAQTCRTLHGITSDWYFWDTLRSILESKPGIQLPFFEADNKKSLDDLRRYTLKILRAHDAWLAPSEPQFRSFVIKSPHKWHHTEVLPGGKWLFGLDQHEEVVVVDLDSARHRCLIKTYLPEDHNRVNTFQLSFKEGIRSSFRIALFATFKSEDGSRICICQVDYCTDRYPPFRVTHLTTIWDTETTGFRNSVEVSDRYIFQCYSLRENGRWENGRDDEILQIRRLKADPNDSQNFVERSVAEEGVETPKLGNCQCKARLLPHDRLVVIVTSAIKIYAIDDSSDTAFPELHLLHRLGSEIQPYCISRPFVGQDGTYLIGTCGLKARRVYISHDSSIPPTADILGRFQSPCKYTSTGFGALMSFSCGSRSFGSTLDSQVHGIEMGTYDLTSYPSDYRWLFLTKGAPFDNMVYSHEIAGFDDNVGRLVLYCVDDPFYTPSRFFFVMDTI